MSGAEASAAIQRQNGIHVPLEMVKGSLSDHYDPRANVIRLSETVYGVRSIAAVGVAAHETGHAMQYAQGYAPIQIRNAIVPVTRIASGVSHLYGAVRPAVLVSRWQCWGWPSSASPWSSNC